MSILRGAMGAGIVMAAIGREMAMAREADRIEAELDVGAAMARQKEQAARSEGLRRMRDITDANMEMRMMGSGVMPMRRGRAAGAVYQQELGRRTQNVGGLHMAGMIGADVGGRY